LGLLDIFKRKKKEQESEVKTMAEQKTQTELENLCGGDKEVYEMLLDTMLLDPRKVGVTMKEAAENAKRFEKEKDLIRANIWYRVAGGLAIYEGNVKKVAEYFSESQRLSDTNYSILKDPEKAVAKAQEYYKKHLKE
jgi:hypothetical protein